MSSEPAQGGEWRGKGEEKGKGEEGPVSAKLREKVSVPATLDPSRRECVWRVRPEREMCHTHPYTHRRMHTHTLLQGCKRVCPDAAQPDQFVNARTLRHTSCRKTLQLYILGEFTNLP